MCQSGVKLADDYLKNTKLILEGEKYHLTVGVKWADGTFKLDEKAEPKTIDIKIEKGDGKEESYLGLYEIDGDTLTICQCPGRGKSPHGAGVHPGEQGNADRVQTSGAVTKWPSATAVDCLGNRNLEAIRQTGQNGKTSK